MQQRRAAKRGPDVVDRDETKFITYGTTVGKVQLGWRKCPSAYFAKDFKCAGTQRLTRIVDRLLHHSNEA
jgi:hypothetical protein